MTGPNPEPPVGPSYQSYPAHPGWSAAPAGPEFEPAGPEFEPGHHWSAPEPPGDPLGPITGSEAEPGRHLATPQPESSSRPPDDRPPEKLTERPHPLTPLIRGWIVLLAVLFGLGRELIPDGSEGGRLPPLEWLFSGVGAVALLAVLAGFLSWRFTRFVVDADELRIDSGVLVHTSQRIAFERVQAIDVVQPFAARLFQLAEVRIDIGGGDSAQLRYLGLKRAYELRDYLLARARGHRQGPATTAALTIDARLSDLDEQDEVLVQVPPTTLLLAAVTSHEFIGILVGGVLAIAASLYFQLGWASLGLLLPLGSSLVGFIAQRVTGQFNYTLSRRPTGLRISRGLTSLTSQSLPPRRVQAVQVSQSLIWRRLGFYRIDLAVVGWGALSSDEDSKNVNTIMLPAGTAAQVGIALAALWPSGDYRQVALTPAPRAARWLHPLSAPFLRWGFNDRFFVSQHGWLVRRWQIVPHTRAQSVAVHQGPVSRRLGLADIAVHTAGLQLATRARGAAADHLIERLAVLQAHLHHKPEVDVSETPDQPAARRADQAEDTISSTE